MATRTQEPETTNGPGTRQKGPKTRAEQGTRERICRTVRIRGTRAIIFDRYAGDNETKLEPWQKLYLGGPDGKTVCLPTENIMSFLSAQNTDSAPKRLLDPRKYKNFALACGSFVDISPIDTPGEPGLIPFLRDNKPIIFGKIDGKNHNGNLCDTSTGIWIQHSVARLKDGIPNPKIRPVLPTPWELEFFLTLYPNKQVQEQQLMNIFEEGLICLGLGTWRGRYGKGEIIVWD